MRHRSPLVAQRALPCVWKTLLGTAPDGRQRFAGCGDGTGRGQLCGGADSGRGPVVVPATVTIPAHRCTDRAAAPVEHVGRRCGTTTAGRRRRRRIPVVKPNPCAHIQTHTDRRRRRLVNGNVFERACGLQLSCGS